MKIIIREQTPDIREPAEFTESGQEPFSIQGIFGGVPANIYESDDEYQIDLLAPGFEKEDFTADINGNGILTIRAESSSTITEKDTVLKQEFAPAGFSRSFRIPEEVLVDELDIFYEAGLLTILLPKDE